MHLKSFSLCDQGEDVTWVDEFGDFPEGLQKIFRKSKLTDEEVKANMHVVLNVVRFL